MSDTETFPSTHAALPPHEAIVAELLKKRIFLKRRYAWVAQHGNFFLKIPRIGKQAEEDARSPEAQAMARQEFDELMILANLAPSVIRPTALVQACACLILPNLQGDDLRPVLLRQPAADRSQRAVIDAIGILAQIHKASKGRAPSSLLFKNYPPQPRVANHVPAQEKVIIIEGFEIRNFLLQDDTDALWFYDPHVLAIGFPEEDVMRFVLSLLMLNWSRSAHCKTWTKFSLAELIAHYEQESRIHLDRNRLRYCFQANLERRFANAATAISLMPVLLQPFARTYRSLYFKQVHDWAVRHEL